MGREMIKPYWFFYITDVRLRIKYMGSGFPTSLKSIYKEIYAYTNIKVYAKRFKDSRDMSIFKMEKRDLTKDEINDLAKEIPTLAIIECQDLAKDHEGNIRDFNFVCTSHEWATLNASTGFIKTTLFGRLLTDPIPKELLRGKYRYLLAKIKYWYFYDPEYDYEFDLMLEAVQNPNGDNDIDRYHYFGEPQVDMLTVFLYHYSELLKEV